MNEVPVKKLNKNPDEIDITDLLDGRPWRDDSAMMDFLKKVGIDVQDMNGRTDKKGGENR